MVTRRIRVRVRGNWHTVEVSEPIQYPLQVVVDGEALEVEVEPEAPGTGPAAPASQAPPTTAHIPVGLQGITEGHSQMVRSPMPGHVVAVAVKLWDSLQPGSEVCVLETMKMEQSVQVSHQGIVRAIFISPGDSVVAGDPLIQLE